MHKNDAPFLTFFFSYRFTSPSFLISTAVIVGLFIIVFKMAKKQDIVEAKKAATAEIKEKK